MAAADEIAIKLGINVGDFKAALSDANASVKKLKKEGEGDFFGGFKAAKKSFNDLKDVLVAGGVATAVVKFFQVAIDGANKSTDATDKNAAAVREFGRSIEEIKGVASTVAVATVGFFNRIGSAIGDVINTGIAFQKGGIAGAEEQQKVARLVEETAKAADQAERNLAESRKKHGAEFLSITKELADIEKKSQEQKLKGLSAQETEFNLAGKVAELRSKAQSVEGSAIDRRRLAVEIAKTQLDLDAATLAVKKEQQAFIEKIADEDKRHAEALAKNLGDEQRIAALRAEVTKAEAAVTAATGDRLESNKAILELKKAQNALSEEEARILEATRKARALDGDLEAELLVLRKKNAAETISNEQERVNVITLQNQALLTQRNIAALLAKEAATGLTQSEENKLIVLQDQAKVIAAQLDQQKLGARINLDNVASSAKLTAAEKDRLSVLELESQRQANIAQQKDLQGKIISQTITPSEIKTLETLREQQTTIDKQISAKQKISLGIKEDLELFTLQSKNAAALTDAERARLIELLKQTEEKRRQTEIELLHGKLINETITPAEKARLGELLKQSEQYAKQVQAKIDLAKVINNQQAPAEEEITGNYADQIGMIGSQITQKDRLIAKAAGVQLGAEQTITEELKEQLRLAQAREGVKLTVTNVGDLANLSQNQLQALIQSLNKQISLLQAASPFQKSPEQLILQPQLLAAIEEMEKRTDFLRTVQFFGTQKAEVKFAPDEFQRFSQLFSPDLAKQTANSTAAIANGLAKLFPQEFNSVR